MQSFHEIIQKIRAISINAKQAGTRFEVLILRWFLATPLYDVKRGWLWADFAKAVGKEGNDLGIDLVLEMANGEFWAVQCKFYNQNSRIDEDKVAHFLGHQGWKFNMASPTPSVSLSADLSPSLSKGEGMGEIFTPSPLERGQGGEANKGLYIIDKLRPVGKGNFTELKYNAHITIKDIPPEAHEYIVNGRSPLGWIIDQYQVSIDKDSGIKNDPNDWCGEHNNPRYILELILRVIEVSVRTVNIVKNLPKVNV